MNLVIATHVATPTGIIDNNNFQVFARPLMLNVPNFPAIYSVKYKNAENATKNHKMQLLNEQMVFYKS